VGVVVSQVLQQVGVDARRFEERVADRLVIVARKRFVEAARALGSLAGERESVRVDTRGGEADKRVPCLCLTREQVVLGCESGDGTREVEPFTTSGMTAVSPPTSAIPDSSAPAASPSPSSAARCSSGSSTAR